MEQNKSSSSLGLFALGLMLALGFIGSAWVITMGARDVVNYDKRITVKGYAEKPMKSDLAIWSGGYSVSDPDLTKAYEKLNARAPEVEAFLVAQGFDKGKIEKLAVSKSTTYKRNEKGVSTNEVQYYTLSRSYSIETAKVDLVAKLSNRFSSLISKGIDTHASSPKYYYTKAGALKLKMLQQATENAYERAKMLVGKVGKVGKLRSARQGVFQITAEHSTSVSGYGVNDTSSINKVIKAIVTIEYTID